MEVFKGTSLWAAPTIKEALSNYETMYKEIKEVIDLKVKDAEGSYTPSWWDRVMNNISTLKSKHNNSCTFVSYYRWLEVNGYITITKDEFSRVKPFSRWNNTVDFGLWKDDNKILRHLSDNGSKSVYVTPNQAAFIRRFKEK